MDSPVFKTLRICPTTQQGGTQTIQQSIYLTHNNPCGANLLIFQKMGLTQIRYVDLKNYLEEIVGSEEMRALFEEIRNVATQYIVAPDNQQLYYHYLYTIMEWAKHGMTNLSVPENYYPGYRFRIDVYDASGTVIYDSFYPILEIITYNDLTGLYVKTSVPILPSQPTSNRSDKGPLYKLTSVPRRIPFIDDTDIIGFSALLSNFLYNQAAATETQMAVASLLIDSANTRTFGIPKYGFSARQNISPFGGIMYNCVNFIDINTVPDEDGKTTLVESIFFRISLNEDTYNFSLSPPPQGSVGSKLSSLQELEKDMIYEEIIQDEDCMTYITSLVNRDISNLEKNMELLRKGENKQVVMNYYDEFVKETIKPVENT